MATLGADKFKRGLPKIYETPTCANTPCTENAFVISAEKGLVCGKCFLLLKRTNEDAIITEAAKIVQGRQCQ